MSIYFRIRVQISNIQHDIVFGMGVNSRMNVAFSNLVYVVVERKLSGKIVRHSKHMYLMLKEG
jgi:hypothetical protein